MVTIVFEHDDFLVINKPVDIGMHGPGETIVDVVKNQTKLPELFLVHRLDTPTSGCLLLAKTKTATRVLSNLFAQRLVQKFYIALIDTKPKKKQGKISGDMQKSRGGSYKLSASQLKPAITFFFTERYSGGNLRMAMLKPITGKTHQLRVALKSLGSPILGDKRYKGTESDRLYLHNFSLSFEYNKQTIEVSCLPEQGQYFTQHSVLSSNLIPPEELNWPNYKAPMITRL